MDRTNIIFFSSTMSTMSKVTPRRPVGAVWTITRIMEGCIRWSDFHNAWPTVKWDYDKLEHRLKEKQPTSDQQLGISSRLLLKLRGWSHEASWRLKNIQSCSWNRFGIKIQYHPYIKSVWLCFLSTQTHTCYFLVLIHSHSSIKVLTGTVNDTLYFSVGRQTTAPAAVSAVAGTTAGIVEQGKHISQAHLLAFSPCSF